MYYFLIPILGALGLAWATIMEKIVLRKKKIDSKLFQTSTFFAAMVVMLPLLYFFWKLDPAMYKTKNLLIFAGVLVSSVLANLFLFFAIKWERISNIEPALITEPLWTILIALVFSFFTQGFFERDFNVIIPGFIAAIALVISHVRKHHLEFNKYFTAAIFASFFFGLELVVSRLILDYFTPISFYFFRCTGVFLISLILFRPQFSKISKRVRWNILLIGSLWVAYRVLVYYGYILLGVYFTTLLVMLAPVFVYIFARFVLKEKLDKRNIFAAAVIVACVLYVILA